MSDFSTLGYGRPGRFNLASQKRPQYVIDAKIKAADAWKKALHIDDYTNDQNRIQAAFAEAHEAESLLQAALDRWEREQGELFQDNFSFPVDVNTTIQQEA